MNPKLKWRFAIGTTSRVPGSGGSLHYLIADFDTPCLPNMFRLDMLLAKAKNVIFQRTQHGWHLYTDIELKFDALIFNLDILKADSSWIKIGERRGYFFLADKDEIDFPYPVEHMVIHYKKEKNGKP